MPHLCVTTPPGPDGRVDAATLVAASLSGVETIYKCGGAQAVAAVAFGTRTIRRCDKVLGPGSPWVVAAKRLLAGRIDPGIPAGPSEAIVLADETCDPRLAALDLLVEAEHGPDSSAFLVTPSRRLAEAVAAEIPRRWADMGAQRRAFSEAVLGGPRGGIVVTPDLASAVAFVNDYAPEHLAVLTEDPFAVLGKIRNASEILLGRHTAIPVANYVLGPNAVLPTNGAARTVSPLSTFDFMKRQSVGYVTREGYRALAPHAHRLAVYEGFENHAAAVSSLRDAALGG